MFTFKNLSVDIQYFVSPAAHEAMQNLKTYQLIFNEKLGLEIAELILFKNLSVDIQLKL